MYKKYLALFLLVLTLVSTFKLHADYGEFTEEYYNPNAYAEEECDCRPWWCGNVVTIGPEYYYLRRNRSGGTKQGGPLIGVRATFEHLRRSHIYVGLQAFYATGTLNGHSASNQKLRSRWTDEQLEATLGYTYQTKNYPYFSFTPFAGYGYFRESNKFTSPSPLRVKFVTQFPYVAYGFLSSVDVMRDFSIGINGRFKYLWNPKCQISNDSSFGHSTLLVGNSFIYRIEVPVTYRFPILFKFFEISTVPFYEQRIYGGRENFPFDFARTNVMLFGINIQLMYRF